ncbi:MAG: hypothetical protein HYX72_10425 [Acidobacteria bacterium]|nr:hypothetical protein [Acidobacteriota bacterium]
MTLANPVHGPPAGGYSFPLARRPTSWIDHLTFRQLDMLKVGVAGLTDLKRRLRAGLGPTGMPAKSLAKRYAIQKSKHGKGNKRDLWFTGKMLGNLQVRTVSDRRGDCAAYIGKRAA